MNVYDFDKTIYKKDSAIELYLYCLFRKPSIIFCLPKQLKGFILYFLGKVNKEVYKEHFYTFLNKIENVDNVVDSFWNKNIKHINKWYLVKQKEDDVVISASPQFLIIPICEKLGIKNIITSDVDKNTGKCLGINCRGQEKVKRFNERYKNQEVNEFYSDSLSDKPLMEIAKASYIVKGNKIVEYKKYVKGFRFKVENTFKTKTFLLFFIIGIINAFNGILFAYLYSMVLYSNIAFILGYITSLTISYLLNSKIAFKESLDFKKYVKFCISYIPNFIIQNIVVFAIYNVLHMHKLIAFVLAAIIGIPITFICIKMFAFKERKYKK